MAMSPPRHLHRVLWAARLVTVALGLVVVVALLHLQQQRQQWRSLWSPLPRSSARSEALEVSAHLSDEQLKQEAARAQNGATLDEEGILDGGGGEKGPDELEQEAAVAFSLNRIARLLGWGSQQGDVDAAEGVEGDGIDVKDWRPLADSPPILPWADENEAEVTTEWQANALLRAFMARFGQRGWATHASTTLSSDDVDVAGEMVDFVPTSSSELVNING